MSVRAELENRFAATVRDAGVPLLELPPALAVSMAHAAELAGGTCPERLSQYYTEEMPRELVAQLYRRGDPAVELLWREFQLGRLPRLYAALSALPKELLHLPVTKSVATLYQRTLFASGLPMVGAYPLDRKRLARELAEGKDPEALIDLRLSGNLVHEICHGPPRDAEVAPCWLVTEAAALSMNASAFARHIWPDEPGEAIPGVSLFVLLGDCLARLFGRRALLSVLTDPRPLAEVFPCGEALEIAGWQEWLERRDVPFARDALLALDWIKLAALCKDNALPAIGDDPRVPPSLLAFAHHKPWSETGWWRAEPTEEDRAMVPVAVRALFAANVLEETFQTWPAEVPQGLLFLDVEACTLSALPRPKAVFGEPARWIFPPPLARKLWQSGLRRLRIENVRRQNAAIIAGMLLALCDAGGTLAPDLAVQWPSSR